MYDHLSQEKVKEQKHKQKDVILNPIEMKIYEHVERIFDKYYFYQRDGKDVQRELMVQMKICDGKKKQREIQSEKLMRFVRNMEILTPRYCLC
jgi:hypothetical protein